jgi:hypothetical protein
MSVGWNIFPNKTSKGMTSTYDFAVNGDWWDRARGASFEITMPRIAEVPWVAPPNYIDPPGGNYNYRYIISARKEYLNKPVEYFVFYEDNAPSTPLYKLKASDGSWRAIQNNFPHGNDVENMKTIILPRIRCGVEYDDLNTDEITHGDLDPSDAYGQIESLYGKPAPQAQIAPPTEGKDTHFLFQQAIGPNYNTPYCR